MEEVEVEEAEVEEVEVEEEKAETKGQHCCKTMEQWSGICAAPTPQSYFLSQPNQRESNFYSIPQPESHHSP